MQFKLDMRKISGWGFILSLLVVFALAGCGGGGGASAGGGGSVSYTIGGLASGLAGSMVLQNNGSDNLTVSASGTFTFATAVTNGSTYNITVLTQPAGQTCTVSTGAGAVSVGNVANVAVVCAAIANTYSVGGTVSGLVGYMVLKNNNGDNLITTNGTFTFASQVANGSPYSVTVFTHPAGQSCSVVNGNGTIATGNVTNIAITCAATTYTIGGSVSGLSGSLVLQDNGGANLNVSVNGGFTFPVTVANGNPYSVTVFSQPTGQTCTVSSGAGTVSAGDVANVTVVCAANAYSVGGTVSGLTGALVLQDNNGDNLAVAANNAFTFITPIANGSPYSVTVLSQPAGQSCSIVRGTGTITAANVSNIEISCATNSFTVGGTVSGLSGSMVLQDNGADNLTVSANGSFTFPAAVVNGGTYNVTLLSQQFLNQNCSITGGSGTVSGNVTGVVLSCVTPPYAFTANYGDNSVSTYGVDGVTGLLTYSGKAVGGVNPYAVTVDPSGRYAYVTNFFNGSGGNSVSQYIIGAGGALTPMATATVAAGTNPSGMTIDPSGKYAYVANQGSNNVSQYSISTGGALSPMLTTTVPAGAVPSSVTIDPSGKYAYVTNFNFLNLTGGDTVSQYTIAANGVLTPMTPPMVAAVKNPVSVTVDPSGKYAYVANRGDNTVSQYAIGAGGALTQMTPAKVVTGVAPTSVTVDPTGRYAYVANQGGSTVSQFTIGAGGALAPMTPATVVAGTNPYSVTVDPLGKYVYVANANSGTVSQYALGAGGGLTPLAPATVVDAAGSAPVPTSITVTAGH